MHQKDKVFVISEKGRNYDGVIARRGIVSHHLWEEKPRESFLCTVLDFALKSLKNGAKIMIEFEIFDHMHL